MHEPNDRNRRVIETFRANAGNVEGRPLILLTTTGARSGRPYTTPVMFLKDGEHIAVFATHGGAPRHPDWYANLVAHPTVTLEIGPEKFAAKATPITGPERDRIYGRQAELYPQFADYQQKTTRIIPVVLLDRLEGA